jgi:hypothetical protein
VHRHHGAGRGRVANHVGQRLLHDPIGGDADWLGYLGRRTVDTQRHGHVAVSARLDQIAQPLEARCRPAIGSLAVVPQLSQHHPQLVQHIATGPLDFAERLLGRLGATIHDVSRGARLHVDRGHRVGHAVVQVAGDPQPVSATRRRASSSRVRSRSRARC